MTGLPAAPPAPLVPPAASFSAVVLFCCFGSIEGLLLGLSPQGWPGQQQRMPLQQQENRSVIVNSSSHCGSSRKLDLLALASASDSSSENSGYDSKPTGFGTRASRRGRKGITCLCVCLLCAFLNLNPTSDHVVPMIPTGTATPGKHYGSTRYQVRTQRCNSTLLLCRYCCCKLYKFDMILLLYSSAAVARPDILRCPGVERRTSTLMLMFTAWVGWRRHPIHSERQFRYTTVP